jgi:hypothetical protein
MEVAYTHCVKVDIDRHVTIRVSLIMNILCPTIRTMMGTSRKEWEKGFTFRNDEMSRSRNYLSESQEKSKISHYWKERER